MNASRLPTDRTWRLPPLILHPFSDASGPDKLAESSRASLMLQGLLPNDEFTFEELNRRLLEGRFYEIRMLCYVGKDLERWIEQCFEFCERDDELRDAGLRAESFAALLVEGPPDNVRTKLESWGVIDHKSIFIRALGLSAVFLRPPERDMLTDGFLHHHYRYAEQFYRCRQHLLPSTPAGASAFQFEIYASAEYARMLEKQWETD